MLHFISFKKFNIYQQVHWLYYNQLNTIFPLQIFIISNSKFKIIIYIYNVTVKYSQETFLQKFNVTFCG